MKRLLGIAALLVVALLLLADVIALAGDSGALEKTLLACMVVLLLWAATRIGRWAFSDGGGARTST